MTILNNIKQAVCLTLDKRIDNFEPIALDWILKNINVEMFLAGDGSLDEKYDHIDDKILPPIYTDSIQYATWYSRSNVYDAWKCHQKILKNFCRNYADGYLLILEDDSKMEEDFGEILSKCEEFFEQHRPEMLYLGAFHYEGSYQETTNPNVLHLNGSGGWHGVIISAKVCRELQDSLPLGPFDWLSKEMHKKYPCYAIYPSIVNQVDGFSEVEGCHLSKPSRWKK